MINCFAKACILAAAAYVTPVSAEEGASTALVPTISVKNLPASSSLLGQLDLAPEALTYMLTSDANLRVGPHSLFHVRGTVHKGDTVTSIGRAKTWIAIDHDGQTLFVWDGALILKEKSQPIVLDQIFAPQKSIQTLR
jgi:uncharacterized protein YgiM (DUF1202 family)